VSKDFIKKGSAYLGVVMFSALLGGPVTASSDSFPKPDVPIRLVVPYAAGGGTDAMARAIAPELAKNLNATVVVENKPGAGTLLGTSYAAKELADGHVILVTTTAFIQTPSIYKKVPFDPIKDFIPVSLLAKVPLAFTVPAASPANSVKEYVELAKKNPESYAIGNYGTGTLSHIQGAMFVEQAGLDVAIVAYKGAAPLAADIAGEHVGGGFVDMSSMGLAKGGRIRYLAVSGDARLSFLPDVPTMTEEGFKDFEIFGWAAMFLPAGTPEDIVEKISEAAQKGMESTEFKGRLEAITYQPGGMSRAEFTDMVGRDIKMWDSLIKSVGIEPQ